MAKRRKKELGAKEKFILYYFLSFVIITTLSIPLVTLLKDISDATCLTIHIINISISFLLAYGLLSLENYVRYRYFSPFRKIKDVKYHLQGLSPYDFEKEVTKLFRALGYKKVTQTSRSKDYGADIIMEDKKGKYVVEVKKYGEKNLVGRPLLQKLQGASDHYRASAMKFVTLGYYSSDAIEYAKQHNIHLINGDELIKMFLRVKR